MTRAIWTAVGVMLLAGTGAAGSEWAPTFVFGIQFDDRQEVTAASSSGGTWVAKDAEGEVVSGARLDWSRVRGLAFSDKDSVRYGLDSKTWGHLMTGVQLREGAPLAVAVREPLEERSERNRNPDRTRPRVGFRAGPEARIVGDRSSGALVWTIEGLRRDPAADVAAHRVSPPTFGEYSIWLLLPPLADLIGSEVDEREVRDELRQEVIEEVREELRDEVREEVREGIREEIREEVAAEVREELLKELGAGGDCSTCPRPLRIIPVPARDST